MQDKLDGYYALGSEVDASTNANFVPVGTLVGTVAAPFSGILDGLGHRVTALTINRPTENNVGLIGYNTGTVRNIGVAGNVKGNLHTGGLVGYNTGIISNAYATGDVTGADYTGGLVGYNSGSISNAYATGAVNGTTFTGGLVGLNDFGSISNAYASGKVNDVALTDTTMIGQNSCTLTNVSALGVDPMQQQGSFTYDAATKTGFDFTNTWRIYEGHTTPLLKAFLKPLTVTASDVSKTYYGATYQADFSVTHLAPAGALSGTPTFSANALTAVNANTYSITPAGLWSTTYDISYAKGTLTIKPAALTITAKDASKIYGQTASFNGFTTTLLANSEKVDTVNLSSSGSVATAGVQSGGYAIVARNATGTFNAANYTINYVDGTLTVIPKPLTGTFSGTPTKVYDGTTTATFANSVFSLQDLVGTDAIRVTQTGGTGKYVDKNVGTGIAVGINLDPTTVTATTGTLSNYTLPAQATGFGTITRAPLRYVADKTKVFVNSPFPTFTGQVAGLVNDELLASVASGTPVWKTTATTKSRPGLYAINGSGLTPTGPNYTIVGQDPGNTTALTIVPIPTCTKNKCEQKGRSDGGPSDWHRRSLLTGICRLKKRHDK